MDKTNKQSLYNFGRFILCMIPPLFYLTTYSDSGFLGGLKWVVFYFVLIYVSMVFIAGYFMPAPGRKLHPAFVVLIITVVLMTAAICISSNPFSLPNLITIISPLLSLGLAYLQARSAHSS